MKETTMSVAEMDEAEMDDLDELTLLDYLAHGLFGYIIGTFLYCIYLMVAKGQSSEDDYGFIMVWGHYISDIIGWGLIAPIGCAISGLLQAWFAPVAYLRYRELLALLIIGAVFISAIANWIMGSIVIPSVHFLPYSPSLTP
jgi:hypothetical protein